MTAIAFLVNDAFRDAQNALDPALRAVGRYRDVLAALAELPDATAEVRAWARNHADRTIDLWYALDGLRWTFPCGVLPSKPPAAPPLPAPETPLSREANAPTEKRKAAHK